MGASKIFSAAVNPSRASSAATTPFSAARPAFSAFAILPRFARMPAEEGAAREPRRCRGGAEYADGPGGMEAVEVMARIDRIGQPAGDLHADNVGGKQFFPARRKFFRDGQSGGENRRGGMRQLAERGFRRRCELRIVVIEHVALDGVGERAVARRGFDSGTENRRLTLAVKSDGVAAGAPAPPLPPTRT